MTRHEWRSIPLRDIDWARFNRGRTPRAPHSLRRMCSDPWFGDGDKPGNYGFWREMTLGELADRGERWWIGTGNGVGARCAETIKATIDAAARGENVRMDAGPASDAYIPECER